MLKIESLTFAYGKKNILDNFNLTVNDGECVLLCGKSGSGKTTVARLVLGLERAAAGSISAPENISCVFQEDRLLNNMDVLENVCLNVQKGRIPFAETLLDRFGLKDWKYAKIGDLSGGMKRRVAIARAICHGGDLLILDEPFNAIDYETKKVIADIIKQEYTDKGKSVLLISHIPEDAELLNAKRTVKFEGA